MIIRSAALMLLWLALWGDVSVANIGSGVLVVTMINWLFVEDLAVTYRLRIWPAVRLLAFVLQSLVVSSFRVLLAVVRPNPKRIATSVQHVTLQSGSPFVGAIVANAITLTPGTMSIELDPQSMLLSIHVLGEVEPDAFQQEVLSLEQRVMRAVSERRNQS
jgi:multicomponent Na+:H+ antiporter subunit E